MKTTLKRLSVILLTVLVLVTTLPVAAFAAGAELTIASCADLKAFADAVNGGNTYEGKTVRLDVNIDLGGESNPWTPIGKDKNQFKGTFDGGYHVISGLFIASGSKVGLFGYVDGGTVSGLVVQGSVKGSANVAGVVGYLNAGQVTDCANQATVAGGSNVGGVVGYVGGASTVSRCTNSGAVSGTTGYIGGVTGQHWRAGTVESCYNSGTVTGPATVGGIVGGHKAASPVLTDCYNAGTVVDATGNANNIGAVIGATRGKNTNCYYLKGTGTDTKAGVTEVETLNASMLGSAFVDGTGLPVLAWEGSVCTDAPVGPGFTESTALSAQLAAYIKAAVNSAKTHAGVSGTLLGNADYMKGASSTATDWMALAMGRFGYFDGDRYVYLIDDGTGYADYLAAMKAYMEETYAKNGGILHSAKATEWHRAVVAIAALGGDPTNFGTYNGSPIDLIADGSYNSALRAGPGTQGINGWIWGLIALDTGMYSVPADAKFPRETFITEILKMQLTDGVNGKAYGGWVLGGYGSTSDVDITAMALQALAPYYNDDTVYTYTNENSKTVVSKTVRQCVDEALDRLGTMMNSSGGFTSWNTNNVESISQVMVALCALGIDPAKDGRFITAEGKTLLDGMLQFRLADGGFCHVLNSGWNSMANDQATYALVSYWRFENGLRALYDMRGDRTAVEEAAVEAAAAAIAALPQPAAADYKAQLKAALEVFRRVPAGERRYVRNYAQLAGGMDLVGGEAALDTNASYIISISVTQQPDKLRYYEDDTFDPAGMRVTALYSDGSTGELQEYTVSPGGKLALGTDTVYIQYGVLRATVTIEVRERLPWAGEGTQEKPYLLGTADALVDLQYYLVQKRLNTAGVHFRLTQDINLQNVREWQGIAANVTGGFCGYFHGDGHTVWNMNGSTYNVCGLFSRLGDGAVIEDLTVASGQLGGGYTFSVGGIAGSVVAGATATIRRCHSYAALAGSWGIGGIIGQVDENATAVLEECSNHGVITASYTGGGLIGQVGPNRRKANGAKAVIRDSYNAGEIRGGGSWGLGGLVGSYRLGGTTLVNTIENCYTVGNVAGSTAAGAVFGSLCETALRLENVYYLDTANTKVNGTFTDDGSDVPGTVTGEATAKTAAEMQAPAFVMVLGSAFAPDTQACNQGYPVLRTQTVPGAEAPVRAGLEIGTVEELCAFAARVNAGESFTNKTIALTADLDLSAVTDWVPIGRSSKSQFDGLFDGQGHVIDNLYSTKGGLFGYAGTNAVIRNVGLASGEIGASNLSFVGGIIRWSNGANVLNCWNGADIYCSGYSGGIVGTVRDGGESAICGCYNVGSVYASVDVVGGIVGHLATSSMGTSVNVTVTDCYNAGAIKANNNAGGIVGNVQDGHTFRRCYNVGTVTITETSKKVSKESGGIAAMVTRDNTLTDCYYDADAIACGVSNGNDTTTGKTAAEMQTADFAALLGDAFKPDRYALVNGGYPLLAWQSTEEADAIDAVAEAIRAIGTVTLDKEAAIAAARAAYAALSDAAKALVENYTLLLKAEETLAGLKNAASGGSTSGGSISGGSSAEQPGAGEPAGQPGADSRPGAGSPQTGDCVPSGLYGLWLLAGLCAVLAVGKAKRRRI